MKPRSIHEVLAELADRIEAKSTNYQLAHAGLATHVFKTIADEIRASANETRNDCKINTLSSRRCERGTSCCDVEHEA